MLFVDLQLNVRPVILFSVYIIDDLYKLQQFLQMFLWE
jgi:hypothetical protein